MSTSEKSPSLTEQKTSTENQTLNLAIEAVKRGWRLLPLRLKEKRPLWVGWPDKATSDEERITDWWDLEPEQGYGIVTGKDSCIVLDVDVKNGQPGMQSLKEIFSDEELETFAIVETPSGGLHIYFSSEQEIRNSQGFMPGLDIRGNGGYIIGPGTSIDGKEYHLVNGNLNDLPSIPEKLVVAINSSRKKQREVVQRMIDADTDNIIGEGDRNSTLFQVACKLRDDFIGEEEALDKLLQLNESRCEPPMDEQDIETIIQSAFSREPNLMGFLDRFPQTEKGASEILLHFHRPDWIYIPEFKGHAFFGQHLWAMDNILQVERSVKFITEMYGNAKAEAMAQAAIAVKNGDKELAKVHKDKAAAYRKMESKTGSNSWMKNIVDIAKSEIVVNQCQLDADDFQFAVLNGVVNLRTGEYSPVSRREDYITMRGLVEYDANSKCPEWEKFISDAMLGDREMIEYLQRVVGYMLTGSTKEQALFFLYGLGANGKTTFGNVLQRLLGDYQVNLPSSSLMSQKSRGAAATPDLAMLRGKRLAVASELEENECFNESLVKTMTGGDMLPVRKLYADFFQLEPKFKLVVVGNHKPFVRGTDDGIWRRIHLIHFRNQVPKAMQDKGLEDRLMAELPAILNWAIEGCLKWQQSEDGLGMPELVKQETQNYRKSEDLLQRFIDDCCTEGAEYGEYQKHLYSKYKEWAEDNHEYMMSNRKFGEKLREHGYKKVDRSAGNYWFGLKEGRAVSSGDDEVVDIDFDIYTGL